jgi:hypothetical protein
LGAPHDPLQPEFDIKLDTGVKDNQTANTKPSLTDEEAVAVWDKLTSSLRVRTSKDASHPSVDAPKAPIGMLVPTGSECPQSGWWYCADKDEISGGRRQHFLEGAVMPHVIVVAKSNLWQKLSGERSTLQKETVWKLLAYGAETPSTDGIDP